MKFLRHNPCIPGYKYASPTFHARRLKQQMITGPSGQGMPNAVLSIRLAKPRLAGTWTPTGIRTPSILCVFSIYLLTKL